MTLSQLRPARLASLALGLLALAGQPSAQTIANGDMNGVANYNSFNDVVPAGWTGTPGGTDLFDGSTNHFGTAWVSSPSGDPFVHGIGVPAALEWIRQTVAGLTVGNVYVIHFEQTVSSSIATTDTHGYWQVDFGPDTQDAPVMLVPAVGIARPWDQVALSFVASSTSQVLQLTARNVTPPPPPFIRVECGLDGVWIQDCGPQVPGLEFVRLGTPPNPFALLPSGTPPVMGSVWDPSVDHTSFVPNAVIDLYAFFNFPDNVPDPPAGTLLCADLITFIARPPTASLNLQIPVDCVLSDYRMCLQVASVDPNLDYHWTNALDVAIGN